MLSQLILLLLPSSPIVTNTTIVYFSMPTKSTFSTLEMEYDIDENTKNIKENISMHDLLCIQK
jgi:hypothetical protein